MDARRVFVTGGTGFLGSHLVKRLIERGDQVTCLVRRESSLRWLDGLPIQLVHGDLRSSVEVLSRMLEGHDAVIHAAGVVRAQSLADFVAVNADGTQRIVDAFLAASPRPRRFVLVSSVGATGPGPADGRLTEGTEPAPVTDYGLSKLEGERRAMASAYDLNLIIIRPTAIYGPRDSEFLPLLRAARSGIIPAFAGRGQTVDLCHVEDVAEAICLAVAVDVAPGSAFIVGTGREVCMGDLAVIYSRVVGRRVHLLSVPRFLLVVVAAISGILARIRSRPAMLNLQKIGELTSSWHLDVTRSRDDLGFSPRWDLEAGLASTLAWYKKEGWL